MIYSIQPPFQIYSHDRPLYIPLNFHLYIVLSLVKPEAINLYKPRYISLHKPPIERPEAIAGVMEASLPRFWCIQILRESRRWVKV